MLVDILEANHGRKPKRVRLKLKRMAGDSFAFYRGTCHRFVHAWDELRPPDPGPPVLVCGDLHLENFGAYRDDDGDFLYDINDFDEATDAPCSVDLVRCAASLLLAAELWELSPLRAMGMVLAYLDEYRAAVTAPVHVRAIDASAPRMSRGPIWELLGKTALASQVELLDHHTERLKNGTRKIVRDKRRHPAASADRGDEVMEAVEAYGRVKGAAEFYHPLDVTERIAGVGSLGVERYLVLVAGGGSAETNRLLDIKEEPPSAWRRGEGQGGEAARVVRAQRALQAQPAAGLDVLPIGGTEYRLREMIPEENRTSLDRFHEKPGKLRAAVVTAGRLTGLSHLRGAQAVEGRDDREALSRWAAGPALDSVLAAAARFAERTRADFKQYRAELRAPDALPGPLRQRVRG